MIPVTAQSEPIYTYLEGACPFPLPDPTIKCGRLLVPENYDDPENSLELAIRVAILPALNDPLPDPVFYMEGGPGGSALLAIDRWIKHPLRVNRDLILFDQRGAGFSTPSLNCIEFEVPRESEYPDPVTGCKKRLNEFGIDLSQYHSLNNARDTENLRQALGYDPINLYGISYGTRLSLTYMRDYPEHVRAVVLDSVFPPEIDFLGERTYNRIRAFRALFDACLSDAVCRETYPALEENFYDVIREYNANPIVLDDPPAWVPKVVDGDLIADAFFLGMYRTESLPMLPYGISMLANSQSQDDFIFGYELLHGFITPAMFEPGWERPETVYDSWEVQQYTGEVGDIDFAEGVNLSVDCAEEFVFSDPDASVRADAAIIPDELMNYLLRSVRGSRMRCSTWNVAQRDEIETERVRSSAPTLLLSGAFDPITSVAWAISAEAGLPNSRHLVFSYAGHAVSANDPCATIIVTAHINAPYLKPDASCSIASDIMFFSR